jgi:hypothetical protein
MYYDGYRRFVRGIGVNCVTFLQQIRDLLFFSKYWVAIASEMAIILGHKPSGLLRMRNPNQGGLYPKHTNTN